MKLSNKLISEIAVWYNSFLATDFSRKFENWFGELTESSATIYDKAVDEAYNITHEGGWLHRLFDGSHDPVSMWNIVKDTKLDDTNNYGSFSGEVQKAIEKYNIDDLPMHGQHNLNNALMAMYTTFLYGIHPTESFEALKESKGVKRRFEIVFQDNNKLVIDDFAHHPTAILHTVKATVSRFPSKRIFGIVELASNTMSKGYHGEKLYKTTSDLKKAYWLNLSGKKNQKFEYDSLNLLLDDLKKEINNFDVILIMSNKNSKKISEPIIDLIKSK